jgi:predicted DNA-binding transcriptional regulator AlpA
MAGDPGDLLTITEVITILRVSRSAFWRWRRRGTGPPVVRLPGGAVRIRRADLARWLAGRHDHDEEEGTAA